MSIIQMYTIQIQIVLSYYKLLISGALQALLRVFECRTLQPCRRLAAAGAGH